jgi:hypothetical protein
MPFGKQFSPKQVDLGDVLGLAATAGGDCQRFEQLVLARYFASRPTSQGTLAMNTRLAMQQYGLLDEKCRLTGIGRSLRGLTVPKNLYERFAKHILLTCHGAQLLQAVRTLGERGLKPSAARISEQLEMMGVDAGGRGGEKLNPMRLWLEEAGVFRREWEVDWRRAERILGIGEEALDVLSGLTPEQRCYLESLAGLPDPQASYSSDAVRRLAEQRSSFRYDVKQLPKKVLFPLEKTGFIETSKTTAGRGAKPYVVRGTDKLVANVVTPLLKSLEQTAAPLDPRVLRRALRELLVEARDTSLGPDQRGKALEGVALQVLLTLGLRFAEWRKRAHETGGAEVDLVAIQGNGRFVVWQLQCKVASITSREPVDREVGVAQTIRSNVIAFVSAGGIGLAARKASESYMRSTGINVIFLDGSDLDAIAGGSTPSGLVDREFTEVSKIRHPRTDRA